MKKRAVKKITSIILTLAMLLTGTICISVPVYAGTVGRLETISVDAEMAIKKDGSLWALEWETQAVSRNSIQSGRTSESPVIMEFDDGSIIINHGYIGSMTVDGVSIPSEMINNPGVLNNQRKRKAKKVMDDVISVSKVNNHINAAIKTDNSLWAWVSDNKPVKITDDAAIVSDSYIIKTDGSLWEWKFSGAFEGSVINPDKVTYIKIMDDAVAVSKGNNHNLAIKTDGSLWAWGANRHGAFGIETKKTNNEEPVKVMDGVISAAAGLNYSLAVKEDGSVWAWGRNDKGQLGDNTTKEQHSPVKIMDGVVSVMTTDRSLSMALKTDGSVWGWGENAWSILGKSEYQKKPTRIITGVVSISAGTRSTLFVKKNNGLWEIEHGSSAKSIMTNVMPYGIPNITAAE